MKRTATSPWNPTCLLLRQPQRACRAHISRAIPGLRITGREHHSTVEPTIYALSTAPGRAAIAVIRVSGTSCLDIYHSLCPGKPLPKPRHATLRALYRPATPSSPDNLLDSSALILYFPAPRTVTGEDVLELHVHGGPAVVQAVLSAIPQGRRGSPIRYAEPGEFTRRAFLNDRLDLTQVEALGEALTATTEQQRRLAVRGTTRRLAVRYEGWRQQLLDARGELEALIDFSEDQHLDTSPGELCRSVAAQVRGLRNTLAMHGQNAIRGELLRSGIAVALLGAPNAGKSSLLNRIVGREAAIVSQEAGTTRDVVEVGLDLGGYFCRIGDTAGLRQAREEAVRSESSREAIGQIEREGMRRARERALESDVVIVVLSFEKLSTDRVGVHIDPEVLHTAAALIAEKNNVIVAINKADLCRDHEKAVQQVMAVFPSLAADQIHLLSCKDANLTSTNPQAPGTSPYSPATTSTQSPENISDPGRIQAFLQGLIRHFALLTAALTPQSPALGTAHDEDVDPSIWQESLGATERQRLLLHSCQGHLDDFLAAVASEEAWLGPGSGEREAEGDDVVVAAEHLRSAAQCLARMTGAGEAGDVEEVLGVVFGKFCVGK